MKEVELGESFILTIDGCESVTVTAFDANHCPGSAMFLFRGTFGAVLHTGDFRFHPSMLNEPSLCGVSITHLFLDTTYNHPQHAFPSRDSAARTILEIVIRHRESGHRVLMGMDMVGKEELLLLIARVKPHQKKMQGIELRVIPRDN